MNFYQNKIWKTISKDIFNKDIFDITLFWKKYWGIKKSHKKFWININWFQILWIEIPKNISDKEFKQEINFLKNKYSSFNNIFFQLWFINKLDEPFFENRKKIENQLKSFELYPSIKENMPLATVIVDIDKTDDELYKSFSKSAKRNITRWKKNWLYFKIAEKEDISEFYDLWESTAKTKWFHIYPKNEYLKLIDFLRNTWCGNLYLTKKDDTIISWSIEINENNNSYYLYWATNRDYTKTWWHYFLKYEMFKYLRDKWIKKVDLLWVAPTWYENHHLSWVSQFKHTLWWEHIEYYWNYDIKLNKIAYEILKLRK